MGNNNSIPMYINFIYVILIIKLNNTNEPVQKCTSIMRPMHSSPVLSICLRKRRRPEAERKEAGIFPEMRNGKIPENFFSCKETGKNKRQNGRRQ
jgi:hypothetical protein